MEKKHIITLSGKPGSGKSSTADKIAEILNYTRHSAGDMVRHIISENKITLEEYNRLALEDHNLDTRIDDKLRELRDKSDIVVDSRLAFYWIPESFKVYLDLDLEIATSRIFKDTVSNNLRQSETTATDSLDDVAKHVRERISTEQTRFKRLYNIDPYDSSHFDLIINTSRQNPQSVAIAIFDAYKDWLNSPIWKQHKSELPFRD